MAAGVRNRGSSVLDTEVTFVWASSSRLIDVRSRWSSAARDTDGPRTAKIPSQPTGLIQVLPVFGLLRSNLLCPGCSVAHQRSGKRSPIIQAFAGARKHGQDRKSTRLNSSHM